jgi:hypothetical protein
MKVQRATPSQHTLHVSLRNLSYFLLQNCTPKPLFTLEQRGMRGKRDMRESDEGEDTMAAPLLSSLTSPRAKLKL